MATMAEQLAALKKELSLAWSISGGGHEPAYLYLAEQPGLPVIQAYMQEREASLPSGQALPIFSVVVPPLKKDGPALVEVLSRALGLPLTGMREDSFFAREQLGEVLRARQVALSILTDAHHLINRAHSAEWLVCFFREYLEASPLLLIGEEKQMDDLLLWKATAWVVRRFDRIRLPGEPPANRQASLDLLRRLGMDDATIPEE